METSLPPLSDPSQPAPGARIHVLQVIGNAIVGGVQSWVERLIEQLPGRPAGLREQLGLACGCGDGGEVPLLGFVGLQAPFARRQRSSRGRVAAPPGPPASPDRTTSARTTTEREWYRQRQWAQQKQRKQRELHAQRGRLTSHASAARWCGALSAAPRAFERRT